MILLAGCAQTTVVPTHTAPPDLRLTYRAVLVAGSDDTQAFDNGVARMADLLTQSGSAREADIARFSSIPGTPGTELAQAATVLRRIAQLRPPEGQGCFVYITSHGLPKRGIAMMASRQMVGAELLDQALQAGCADRPTVVIVSGCFSGVFAQPPMTRPNRIVLTAARDDRPSFGCGAKDRYTYFDACLFDSLVGNPRWSDAYRAVTTCVSAKETERRYDASYPQAWFGVIDQQLHAPGSAR